MPIYIDRHYIEGATRSTLKDAHNKDLEMQDKHGVKFLTYWFDEARSTAFCLIDSPNKEVVHSAHDEAHGDVPHEIIEVDPSIVESFLGRIKDPLPDKQSGEVSIDSAFRGIMFTDLKDSTLMNTLYGDTKALHLLHIHNALTRTALRDFGGSEIKHTGDGFMVSFTSITNQVNCAIAIQKAFTEHNKKNNDEEKMMETKEVEPESKLIKPEKLNLKKKPDKETKRLSREEEQKWIRHIRNNILK